MLQIGGDLIAQAVIEEGLANRSEIWGGRTASPAQLAAGLGGVAEGRGLHQFEILLVLCCGAAGSLVDPFAGVALVEPAKPVKGGEELVVAAESRGGHEAAQGEGIDQPVVEVLVGRNLRRRH